MQFKQTTLTTTTRVTQTAQSIN